MSHHHEPIEPKPIADAPNLDDTTWINKVHDFKPPPLTDEQRAQISIRMPAQSSGPIYIANNFGSMKNMEWVDQVPLPIEQKPATFMYRLDKKGYDVD